MKYFLLIFINIYFLHPVEAQNENSDSTQVVQTLITLLEICKNVDFNDPETIKSGYFYKAAPYIVYRGEDKSRAWKTIANYAQPEEKAGVDNICEKINRTINQDKHYIIKNYFTETESEGTWHVLMINYLKKDVEKEIAFAFLKIGERFALGDID